VKAIVIYQSRTGFTERYARWIAEASGADCVPLPEAKKKSMDEYQAIVFGGWACAGGISGLKWFKGNMAQWEGKKLAVFCVGASPSGSPDVEPALRRNFTGAELERVRVFYCPGGLNYGRMSAPSRLMMKVFVSTLRAKKGKTEAEQVMVKMLSQSYDISDRKYIEPVAAYLKD